MPSLVPMEIKEPWVSSLQGLSLRNVTATLYQGRKEVYREFGEMLFTHYGVSGPIIISASSYVGKKLKEQEMRLEIDLKPALDEEQLDHRLLRDLSLIHIFQGLFDENRPGYILLRPDLYSLQEIQLEEI